MQEVGVCGKWCVLVHRRRGVWLCVRLDVWEVRCVIGGVCGRWGVYQASSSVRLLCSD